MCDSLAISTLLIVLEFIEVSRLDKIMKTSNGIRRQARKSAAANDSTESSDYSKEASVKKKKRQAIIEDDYPDWKLMLKNINGNENLFDTTPLQKKLTELEKRFDGRNAESCCDSRSQLEEDPREDQSFPTSPVRYKEFDGFEFRVFPKTEDNCYAEPKPRVATPPPVEPIVYKDAVSQAKPSEILAALERKGDNFLSPDLDPKEKKKQSKRTRGRKNHYYT